MPVDHLSLRGFRSYRELEVDFPAGPQVVVGDNAAGKTNLLEAMVVLSQGGSHRTDIGPGAHHLGRAPRAPRRGRRRGTHRGRAARRRHHARCPEAGQGERGAAPDVGAQRRPPCGRVRTRGYAARRRLSVAAPRLPRYPRGAAHGPRGGIHGNVRTCPHPAQQPPATHPGGGRRARRAALLGRGPAGGGRPHPPVARRDPGRARRPPGRRPCRDRARGRVAHDALRLQRGSRGG